MLYCRYYTHCACIIMIWSEGWVWNQDMWFELEAFENDIQLNMLWLQRVGDTFIQFSRLVLCVYRLNINKLVISSRLLSVFISNRKLIRSLFHSNTAILEITYWFKMWSHMNISIGSEHVEIKGEASVQSCDIFAENMGGKWKVSEKS